MAKTVLKREKVIFTNRFASKTVFPFVIDKKISKAGSYINLGRITRPINPNTQLDLSLVFEVTTLNLSSLKIKYEVLLVNEGINSEFEQEIEKNVSGRRQYNITIPNTYNNSEVLVTVSAVNNTAITTTGLENRINLVYLEKNEV